MQPGPLNPILTPLQPHFNPILAPFCNQASCNGDLSSPQYGCKSSTGAVAGITSDTLGWTGRNNCAKMAKIAAGLIP